MDLLNIPARLVLQNQGAYLFCLCFAEYRRQPPRVLYISRAYVVVLRKDKMPPNDIVDLEGYEQLYRILERSKSLDRHRFLTILANFEHQRSKLLEQVNNLSRTSVVAPNDITAWRRTLSQPDRGSMRGLDSFNIWGKLIMKEHKFLEFNSPRLFLVLPKDLDQWDDEDPETHHFRLYFLCEFDYSQDFPLVNCAQPSRTAPAHIHISDHPGYDLNHPREFFQRYGQVATVILELVRSGFMSENLCVPSLKSRSILNCCEGTRARHRLTDTNIKELVDMSIASLSLQNFGTPWKRLAKTSLSVPETRHIRLFLRKPHTDNGLGSLFRTTIRGKSHWLCYGHSFYPWAGKQQEYLMSTFHPRIHKQLGALEVKLKSVKECQHLCAILRETPYIYELSIHIVWEATRDELRLCLSEIDTSGVKVLQIHGIDKIQGRIPTRDMFFNCVDNANIMFIVVDDYRKPSTQSVFLRSFHHMRCLLLCRQQSKTPGIDSLAAPYKPTRPGIDWMNLTDALSRFINELHYMKAGAKPAKDMSMLLKNLSAWLTDQRGLGLEELQIFDAEHTQWQGTFSVKDAVVQGVTKAKILSVLPLDSLIHGVLRKLDVPSPFPDHLLRVQCILHHSPRLQGITLPAQVNSTLAHISFVSQQCHIPSHGIIVTLQHWANEKWRVVAQVRLQNQDPQKAGIRRSTASKAYFAGKVDESLVTVEFQDWKHDYVYDSLEDSGATLLDAATTTFPSVLKSFHLDVSALNRQGLDRIKDVLHRSALEQLHIQCVAIDPSLEQSVARVLTAAPWSTIKSLVFSGDKIDLWIHLWAKHGNLLSVDDEPFSGSQLMRLIIQGTGIAGQPISHESALAIHGLVYISPLLELNLENITFQDERDSCLVIGAVELPSLDPFYRPRSYVQHIKVSVPEQLISTTVEDDVMFSASINVQQRRVNRSRPIPTI